MVQGEKKPQGKRSHKKSRSSISLSVTSIQNDDQIRRFSLHNNTIKNYHEACNDGEAEAPTFYSSFNPAIVVINEQYQMSPEAILPNYNQPRRS